ncbi:MAG: CDP-glucose 4,6-dehydratase, partial [Myxococcota bacterium]
VCNSYLRSFFAKDAIGPHIGFATVRAGNVIGGGDWAKDRLIPDCVRALSKGERIVVRNPGSVRPWQHVLEPLYGYLLLGVKLYNKPNRYSTPFNFGPFEIEHIKVEEVVRMFIDIWGEGNYVIKKEKKRMHEASLLRLVIDKAVNLLGWRPVLSSSDAIKWTAVWYKKWYEQKRYLINESLQNIYSYEKMI